LFISGIKAQDPIYNNIRDYDDAPSAFGKNCLLSARDFTESLWKRYEPYADANFLTEIQVDFRARFWEMYLACSLEDAGYSIECPKPEGPDILVTSGETRVWIEAVAPSGGDANNPDRLPEPQIGQGHGCSQQ
jgi:hypothetical protein